MRQFFKFFFASLLGTIVAGVLVLVLLFGAIAAAGSAFGKDSSTTVEKQSVLHITLNRPIVDQGNPVDKSQPFAQLLPKGNAGLNQLLADLEKAKHDDRIRGVFLDLSLISAGTATLKELRDKLIEFKAVSAKPVVAYAEVYTQGSYYIASVADQVFLTPQGDLDFRGLRSEGMYFKGMFDKLGVEMQLIRGSNNRFKSFGETFISDHMSEAGREQSQALLNNIWSVYLDGISDTRKLEPARLNAIADGLLVRKAQDALDQGMVDGLKYRDEVMAYLKETMGLPADKDVNFVAQSDYTGVYVAPASGERLSFKAPRVAVVYASGDIVTGESSDGSMGSTTICKALQDAREDSTVKAIVLRVNSPGGSGLASDIMWREVELARSAKPVIVSMGDVAASGGYYIACNADRIFAEPNTITGSIGVFAMIPNAKGFFNDKLGITFDGTQTHKHANLFSINRPLTADERLILQGYIDAFYDTFLERVAAGRKLTKAQVDSIGQGRVWAGTDALRIGLVDEIGGLEKAIAYAAEKADLSANSYRIKELPERKSMFDEIMGGFQARSDAWADERVFGNDAVLREQVKKVQRLRQATGIQARMPFDVEIH